MEVVVCGGVGVGGRGRGSLERLKFEVLRV